ncbi:MAG: hypothetical protein P1V97_11580 [Planctomycetota bacterium]|nr:hypothetical protein [Planctomycetota bacterium]
MSELQKIHWGRVVLLAGLCIGVSTGFGTLGALAISRQWRNLDTHKAKQSAKRIRKLEDQLQVLNRTRQSGNTSPRPTSSVSWQQWPELEGKRISGAKTKKVAASDSKSGFFTDKSGENLRLIDIDVVDKDLRAVVEEIGRKVGENILLAQGVEETVTIELRDIDWVSALKIIAKIRGCEISRGPGGVIIFDQPARVTIEFADANVRTVLMLLAAYTGKNIVLDPKIHGYVSLSLKDVHWEKAIQAVCAAHGDFVVFEDSKREILIAKARPQKSRR